MPTGYKWTNWGGDRPPDADHVAPRGTDAYRDAVDRYQQWVTYNLINGRPLEELIDKYDDKGNLSHDWKQWNNWGGGYDRPHWYDEAMWEVGNFRGLVGNEGYTEWPPGSGRFFNDPANDSSAREWYDEFGNPMPPPEDGGPDIDYNQVNSAEYGGSIKAYLAGEQKRREEEAAYQERASKARPIMPQPGQTGPIGVTSGPPVEVNPFGGPPSQGPRINPQAPQPGQQMPGAPQPGPSGQQAPAPGTRPGTPTQAPAPGPRPGPTAAGQGAWGINTPNAQVQQPRIAGFGRKAQEIDAPRATGSGFGAALQKRRGPFGGGAAY